MARVQAFEFEDLAWFPQILRGFMTDFLSFMGSWSSLPYEPFTARLSAAMQRTGQDRLLDLCSGGGGPAVTIARALSAELARPIAVTLTDLYPDLARFTCARAEWPEGVSFETGAVDATNVPAKLTGFRLLCNGFHHLEPERARACLADAVQKGRGIAIVELAHRSPLSVLQICLGMSALLVVTPFIKPFKLTRLLFTFVVPLVPLCTLWDGIVSCLRVYDPKELRALLASIPKSGYEWECGRATVPRLGGALKVTFLIGVPSGAAPAESVRAAE